MSLGSQLDFICASVEATERIQKMYIDLEDASRELDEVVAEEDAAKEDLANAQTEFDAMNCSSVQSALCTQLAQRVADAEAALIAVQTKRNAIELVISDLLEAIDGDVESPPSESVSSSIGAGGIVGIVAVLVLATAIVVLSVRARRRGEPLCGKSKGGKRSRRQPQETNPLRPGGLQVSNPSYNMGLQDEVYESGMYQPMEGDGLPVNTVAPGEEGEMYEPGMYQPMDASAAPSSFDTPPGEDETYGDLPAQNNGFGVGEEETYSDLPASNNNADEEFGFESDADKIARLTRELEQQKQIARLTRELAEQKQVVAEQKKLASSHNGSDLTTYQNDAYTNVPESTLQTTTTTMTVEEENEIYGVPSSQADSPPPLPAKNFESASDGMAAENTYDEMPAEAYEMPVGYAGTAEA